MSDGPMRRAERRGHVRLLAASIFGGVVFAGLFVALGVYFSKE